MEKGLYLLDIDLNDYPDKKGDVIDVVKEEGGWYEYNNLTKGFISRFTVLSRMGQNLVPYFPSYEIY